jgi:hypothetical protein
MRSRLTAIALPLLLLAIGMATACGSQGEGQRCDKLNGNDDCDTGLICQDVPVPAGASICCPQTGTSSVPLCLSVTGVTGSPDAGSSRNAHTDAGKPDAGRD